VTTASPIEREHGVVGIADRGLLERRVGGLTARKGRPTSRDRARAVRQQVYRLRRHDPSRPAFRADDAADCLPASTGRAFRAAARAGGTPAIGSASSRSLRPAQRRRAGLPGTGRAPGIDGCATIEAYADVVDGLMARRSARRAVAGRWGARSRSSRRRGIRALRGPRADGRAAILASRARRARSHPRRRPRPSRPAVRHAPLLAGDRWTSCARHGWSR